MNRLKSIAILILMLLTDCGTIDETSCIHPSKDDILTPGTARQILVIDKKNGC